MENMQRYYQIIYKGEKLFLIYAPNAREAKERAKRTIIREGRHGRNLAWLEAI